MRPSQVPLMTTIDGSWIKHFINLKKWICKKICLLLNLGKLTNVYYIYHSKINFSWMSQCWSKEQEKKKLSTTTRTSAQQKKNHSKTDLQLWTIYCTCLALCNSSHHIIPRQQCINICHQDNNYWIPIFHTNCNTVLRFTCIMWRNINQPVQYIFNISIFVLCLFRDWGHRRLTRCLQEVVIIVTILGVVLPRCIWWTEVFLTRLMGQ